MSNQAEPNIKEIAGQYWRLGLNIVPVKGKTPLIKWAELQSASQSSDDFAELPWAAADGFALIAGADKGSRNARSLRRQPATAHQPPLLERQRKFLKKL